jgi:hypothetical protein
MNHLEADRAACDHKAFVSKSFHFMFGKAQHKTGQIKAETSSGLPLLAIPADRAFPNFLVIFCIC